MVNLTRIYTRTGDAGETTLTDLSRINKTAPRVEAYGAVDEANSLIGLALAQPDLSPRIAEVLFHIQNEMFDVGTDLSNPLPATVVAEDSLRVIPDSVERIERWCDEFAEELPTLRSFVLPSGSQTAAILHMARSVVRRAEREAWRVAESDGTEAGGVHSLVMTYLNRLSDLLFIFARTAAQAGGEVLWVPGKDRESLGKHAAEQREKINRQQGDLNAISS